MEKTTYWDEIHTEPLMLTILREVRYAWSEFKASAVYAFGQGRWIAWFLFLALTVMSFVCVNQGETIRQQRQEIRELYKAVGVVRA